MKAYRTRFIGIAAIFMMAFCSCVVAQNTSGNVVGLFNLKLQPGRTFVTFPYQKPAVATGQVASNAGDSVIAVTDAWVWETGLDEPGESTFYLEITSGAYEGWHFYIADIDTDTITLVDKKTADVADGDLDGATFKVVPANRVRDIFGEPGHVLLTGGTSHRNADRIIRWAGNAWDAPIYANTIDAPEEGRIAGHWYRNGEIADDVVIDRDEAVSVDIRGENPVQLRIIGDVARNAHAIVLEAGLHLIGGAACVPEELAESGLTDIVGTATISSKTDELFAWDRQEWSEPVYRSAQNGKWYQGASEAGDFQIKPATGYMLLINETPVTNVWVRKSPLAQ
jgi:hypothetical protein